MEGVHTSGLKPEWFTVLPAVLIALTTTALSLRIYVRAFMLRSWGVDDWLLLTAYTIFVANAAISIKISIYEEADGGLGLIENLMAATAYTVAADLLYVASAIVLKLALAFFFLRIVKDGWQKWLIGISVSVYALYTTAYWFIALFSCGHPTAINYISDHCLDWRTTWGPLTYIAAALNCIIDWILTLTPITLILRLQISKREKVTIIGLMMLGLLGSVISVIRISYVKDLRLDDSLDYFERIIPIGLCSLSETGIGIICLALAALRPLYARCLHVTKTRLSSLHSSNQAKLESSAHIQVSHGYSRDPEDVFQPKAVRGAHRPGYNAPFSSYEYPTMAFDDMGKQTGGPR